MSDELLKWVGAVLVSAGSAWLALNKSLENARTRLAATEHDIKSIKSRQEIQEKSLTALQVQNSATGAELKAMSRQIAEMSADIKTLLLTVGHHHGGLK